MQDIPEMPGEIAGKDMRFELWSLADMIPATYNPRKPLTPEDPEYQSIKSSIQEFTYSDPIVLNFDGTIIKGHQRRTVMMDMGYTQAWCIVLEIRDKQKEKALNIALNKITGKWDNAILKDLLLELDLNGYDFTVTGFHRDELEDLIQLVDIPAEATDDGFDPDAAAAQIEEPVTRLGDIWQLGRHRLMCGDSTDPDDGLPHGRRQARPCDHGSAVQRELRRENRVPVRKRIRESNVGHRKRQHGHDELLPVPAGGIPEHE